MTRLHRRRVWLLLAALAVTATPAEANGQHGGPNRPEPATKFERAVVQACPLCIQEAHAIASLPAPPLRLAGFSPQVTSAMARHGEARFELLRGYRPGKVGEQFALRIGLFVHMGGANPTPYRFAYGTVDEEDLAVMVTAVAEVARALEALRPGPGSADASEVQFQAGSLRVGGLVTQGGAVAYIQAGDRDTLPAPSLWEAVSTLFFQAGDMASVGQVIARAVARIQELRGK